MRELIAHPQIVEGLATLDGLQFVLPQVVAELRPNQSEPLDAPGLDGAAAFDTETPLRAVLLDGTPVAGHRSLDGGVVIEDVHDLVGRSVVAQRRHATSMASLILRGDLSADGVPVEDSRLLCIPVLVDAEGERIVARGPPVRRCRARGAHPGTCRSRTAGAGGVRGQLLGGYQALELLRPHQLVGALGWRVGVLRPEPREMHDAGSPPRSVVWTWFAATG